MPGAGRGGAGGRERGVGNSDRGGRACRLGCPRVEGFCRVRRGEVADRPAHARRRSGVGEQRRGDRRRGVRRHRRPLSRRCAGNLLDDSGGLHKFVNVYKNDDDIRYLEQLDTKVEAGDVLSILPAVAGGAEPAALNAPQPAWPATNRSSVSSATPRSSALHALSPNPDVAHLGEARGSEPGRLVEGPHRARRWSSSPSATAC